MEKLNFSECVSNVPRQYEMFGSQLHRGEKSGTAAVFVTHGQDGDLGEVVESLPLPLQVLQRSHKHNVLQLVVVEVARPQRHDEVAHADQRRLDVSENADNHVAAQDRHGRFAAGLSTGGGGERGSNSSWFSPLRCSPMKTHQTAT